MKQFHYGDYKTIKRIIDNMGSKLSKVALSGGYSDLEGKPDIPKNAADIGALPIDGDTAETTTTFTSKDTANPTSYTDMPLMQSGEKQKSLFGKLSTVAKNVRYLYKLLGNTDISKLGDGTVTNALATLNSNLNGLDYADVGAFPGVPRVPFEGNINDLHGEGTEGFYWCYGGNEVIGKPEGVGAFGLLVMQTAMSGWTQILFSGSLMFVPCVRVYDGSSWSNWRQLPSGVKGNAETTYRGGDVSLSAADVGAVPVYNTDIVGVDSDWDDFMDAGTYKVQNATMTEEYNAPVGKYPFGTLIVVLTKIGDKRGYQIYLPDCNPYDNLNSVPSVRAFNGSQKRKWGDIPHSTYNDAIYVPKAAKLTITGDMTGSVDLSGADNQIDAHRKESLAYNNNSNANAEPWHKVASIEISLNNIDRTVVFAVNNTYSWNAKNHYGILMLHVRVGSDGLTSDVPELIWEYCSGSINLSDFVVAYTKKSVPVIVELWCKNTVVYQGYAFAVISEFSRSGLYDSDFTFYNSGIGEASLPSGYTVVESTLGTIQNPVDVMGWKLIDVCDLGTETTTVGVSPNAKEILIFAGAKNSKNSQVFGGKSYIIPNNNSALSIISEHEIYDAEDFKVGEGLYAYYTNNYLYMNIDSGEVRARVYWR